MEVVEKAELLRDMEANLLPALLRLQELVIMLCYRTHTFLRGPMGITCYYRNNNLYNKCRNGMDTNQPIRIQYSGVMLADAVSSVV